MTLVKLRKSAQLTLPTEIREALKLAEGDYLEAEIVPGGVLFGIGWALCGACPSVPWVQLGEGKLASLATLAGVFAGTILYRTVHARFFRWDRGSCEA